MQTNMLDLRGLNLTEIPHFPRNVTEINCSGNRLRILPDLPPNLKRFNCSKNVLSSLPILPPSLTMLDCSKNYIDALPDIEHTAITHLICSENVLECLPLLPLKLRCLSCHTNKLQTLPEMPRTLMLLWAQFNQLSEPFQTFAETDDPIHELQQYYDHKRYVREASINLLRLRHTFQNNATTIPSDILNAVGTHLSGITSTIDNQINCLKQQI